MQKSAIGVRSFFARLFACSKTIIKSLLKQRGSGFPGFNGNVIVKAMRLTILLLTVTCLHLHATSVAQTVTLSGRDIVAKKVFKAIEDQTGYFVFANKSDQALLKPVTIDATNMPLREFLDKAFKDQSVEFTIKDKTIVLSPKPSTATQNTNLPAAPWVLNVRGFVRDSTGQALIGASVRIKGTSKGTVTDLNGGFHLEANAGDVLVFSFIGYETKELPANGVMVIILRPSGSNLDMMQITAYGTTTRRYSTGAITTIKGEEIAKNPVMNVLSALRGRVPGMFIQQFSGQPGNAISVTVRGRSTLQSSNSSGQPLYVVDGVPIPNGQLPFGYPTSNGTATGGSIDQQLKGGNILDYLPASMIESVDILTDADATAIYGSRGGYGVILITTKKGKAGKPSLNINAQTGFSVRGNSPELLSPGDYMMIRREAFKNDGVTPGPSDFDVNGTWPETRYTNWQNLVSGSAGGTSLLNATYSGGSGNVNYLVGVNYNLQQSIQRNTGASRTTAMNFNFNTTSPNGRMYASLSGSYSYNLNDLLGVDYSNAVTQAPNAPALFLPDGNLNWEAGANADAFRAFKMINKNRTNDLTFTSEFRYTPIKNLTFRTTIGFNSINSKQNLGYPTPFFDPSTSYVTRGELNLVTQRVWNIEPNVTYDVALGGKGNLTATTGMTIGNRLLYNQYTAGTDFLSDAMILNPTFAATANVTTSYNETPGRNLSYFGILKYDWDHKYILNLTGRYEGSTKFGPNSRFGSFGSVGGAWLMSNEKWFSALQRVINFAKWRGSIGIMGADPIPEYSYINTFTNNTAYNGGVSLHPNGLANADLRWEKIVSKDIELYLEFFKGRLSLLSTYYDKKSSDQLIGQSIATTTGFNAIAMNSPAVISNSGFEFTLSSTNIRKKNFSWKSNFTISLNKNILKSYPSSKVPPNINYIVGKSISGIKLFKYGGVDTATGYYMFYKNGQKGLFNLFTGPLDEFKDRTEFIDLAPKYFGSLQNSFSYKGLNLSFVIGFVNRMGKNFLGSQAFPPGMFNRNVSTVVLQRWQKPGDVAPVQRVSQSLTAFLQQGNFVKSTGAYSNATFARLNNVNIYYTVPSKLFRQKIGNLSVFASGQNLLTISEYKDLDPESLGAGMAPLRTFTAGLNITL